MKHFFNHLSVFPQIFIEFVRSWVVELPNQSAIICKNQFPNRLNSCSSHTRSAHATARIHHWDWLRSYIYRFKTCTNYQHLAIDSERRDGIRELQHPGGCRMQLISREPHDWLNYWKANPIAREGIQIDCHSLNLSSFYTIHSECLTSSARREPI